MCIDWKVIADIVTAVGTATLAITAIWAYRAWHPQLLTETRHEAAAEIAEAVILLRHQFYEARGNVYFAWEFPAGFQDTDERAAQARASAYSHVFQERWNMIRPQLIRVSVLRAKAHALLGAEMASDMGRLAIQVNKLPSLYSHEVDFIRDGEELTELIPNQDWVKYVHKSVAVDSEDHTDKYSTEFETAFETVMTPLRSYLPRR